MNNHEKHMLIICTFLLAISLLGIIVLNPNITGLVILGQTESEFNYTEPENITEDIVLDSLLEAEENLNEMIGFNLSVYFVNDNLLRAKRTFVGDDPSVIRQMIGKEQDAKKKSYLQSLLAVYSETPVYEIELMDYSESLRLTHLIVFKKQQAFNIKDLISLEKEKEKKYRDDEVDTSESFALIEQSEQAFSEERYDEAESYILEADLKLEKSISEYERFRGTLERSRNFFVRYWWQIILFLAILAAISFPATKMIRKKLSKNKLENLRLEQDVINDMIKKAQKECFVDKTISEDTFKIRINRYKSKLARINHTIPVLESIVSGEKKKILEKPNNKGALVVKK